MDGEHKRLQARTPLLFGAACAALTLGLLSGCASQPIRPWYVSPANYQSLNCDALRAEYDRVSRYLARGVDTPRSVWSGMSFGLGGFGGSGWGWGWTPNMTFSSGEVQQDERSVVARLLGEQDAIQSVAAYKGCPIIVVTPPPAAS